MNKTKIKCPFCGLSKVVDTGRKIRVGIRAKGHYDEYPPEKILYECENEKCRRTFTKD